MLGRPLRPLRRPPAGAPPHRRHVASLWGPSVIPLGSSFTSMETPPRNLNSALQEVSYQRGAPGAPIGAPEAKGRGQGGVCGGWGCGEKKSLTRVCLLGMKGGPPIGRGRSFKKCCFKCLWSRPSPSLLSPFSCPSLSLFSGNVLFASALHGWCLSLPSFANNVLLKQLGLPSSALPKLMKTLWGNWYLRRRRTKKTSGEGPPLPPSHGGGAPSVEAPQQPDMEVKRAPFTPGQPRMVEQLVFEPIWQLYAAASGDGGPPGAPLGGPQNAEERLEKLCNMTRALGLKDVDQVAADLRRLLSPARQQRGKDRNKQGEELAGELVAAIMTRWLPVGETLLVGSWTPPHGFDPWPPYRHLSAVASVSICLL